MFKSNPEGSDWLYYELVHAALYEMERVKMQKAKQKQKHWSPRISLLQYTVTGVSEIDYPNDYSTQMDFTDKDELLLDLSSDAVLSGKDAVLKLWNDDELVGTITVIPEWEWWEDSPPEPNASLNEMEDYAYMMEHGVPVHKFDLAVNAFDRMIPAYERSEPYADILIVDSAAMSVFDPTAPPPENLFEEG